jgi:hypothetical protein
MAEKQPPDSPLNRESIDAEQVWQPVYGKISAGCGVIVAAVIGTVAVITGAGFGLAVLITSGGGLVAAALCLLWLYLDSRKKQKTRGLTKQETELYEGRSTFRTLSVVVAICVGSLVPWAIELLTSNSGFRGPEGGFAVVGLVIAFVFGLIFFVSAINSGRKVYAYLLTTRRIRFAVGLALILAAVASAAVLLPVLYGSDHWKSRRALILYAGITVTAFVSGVLLIKG